MIEGNTHVRSRERMYRISRCAFEMHIRMPRSAGSRAFIIRRIAASKERRIIAGYICALLPYSATAPSHPAHHWTAASLSSRRCACAACSDIAAAPQADILRRAVCRNCCVIECTTAPLRMPQLSCANPCRAHRAARKRKSLPAENGREAFSSCRDAYRGKIIPRRISS